MVIWRILIRQKLFITFNQDRYKISNNYNLIRKGILGKNGSIVVDDVNLPKKFLE